MNQAGYQPERRPIASREKGLSKWAASRLAAWGVSPNSISLFGMVAGILAGAAFAITPWTEAWRVAFVAAAALMQLRLLANMFDGMVAVQTGKASPVGELYNEVPDRVSDAFIIAGSGYAISSNPVLGWIAACLALFIAYVRAQGKVAGTHQEFCGPFAKPQRMFLLTLLALVMACLPTSARDWVVGPGWGVMAFGLAILVIGEVITVWRRLTRIAAVLKKEQP